MTIKSDASSDFKEKITPTPKQNVMLRSSATELLLFGSRAGGKSYATYFFPLYYTHLSDFTGLILRSSFSDLTDYLNTAKRFYEPVGAKVTMGGTPKITFPSGAVLYASYMKDLSSLEKHRGKNISLIIYEELSQLPSEEIYEKLLASLRSANKDIKPQMVATTNTDGVGARWIYERWDIENTEKEDLIWTTEDGVTRQAIRSGVQDNPYIMENDPDYVKYLKSLKGNLYKQWYLGEFVFTADKSQYYHQWIIDAEKDNRISDFFIDPSLPVNTAHDIGINDSWSIVFYQQHQDEIRIINYYENNNEGVNHYISYLHDFRNKWAINYGIHYGPHDLAVRELSTGVSRQQTFTKMGLHMRLVPNESIQEGINAVRQILPRCYFHKSNTAVLLQHLKSYRKTFDEKTQNYSNIPFHGPESHGADAFRYLSLTVRNIQNDMMNTNGQMNLGFSV